jgi:tellurite resistance protein
MKESELIHLRVRLDSAENALLAAVMVCAQPSNATDTALMRDIFDALGLVRAAQSHIATRLAVGAITL